MLIPKRLSSTLLALAVLVGCGGRDRPDPDAAAPAHIDAGNALFTAGDHAGALARYRAGVEADSLNAAAWYGIHMAGDALGDTLLAAAALMRVQWLVPDAGPHAHPQAPLPPGHPTVGAPRPPPDAH